MSKRLAFLIDTRYCNNCKTCEIACKMERKLPIGQQWRKVREVRTANQAADSSNPLSTFYVAMSCNHCEGPACAQVCPQNTYRKTPEGPVIQYQEYCIGCTKCVSACPYSAPVYNTATQITGKCDMCYSRLQEGLQPYCVQCCPNNALKIGDYEELVAAYGESQDLGFETTIIPNGSETNPSIVIVKIK